MRSCIFVKMVLLDHLMACFLCDTFVFYETIFPMTDLELVKLVKELASLSQETEWVEFKVNNSDPDKIGKYISALSNSSLLHEKQFGYLLYGIEDETHAIVGTTFRPKSTKIGNEPLEQWLNSKISPKVTFRIFEFDFEGKSMALFKVGAAPNSPVKFNKLGYIRIGNTTRLLNEYPNQERKIWGMGSGIPFEKEIAQVSILPEEVEEWLDSSAYFTLMGKVRPENLAARLSQLASEKLIVIRGDSVDITNLGALLFAKNLTQFDHLVRKAIRVIVYKGKGRIHTQKEQEGRFGYAVKFEGLIDWINDQLPMNEVIGVALRKSMRMYPELAVRELVANAIIHQDFRETGTGVMVEIFEDRIEITNPGKPLIDTLRFMDEPPQSRNEILASFMRRAGICEERGSGIDRVVFNCELFQLPAPDFQSKRNHLKATLFAYKKVNDMSQEDRIRSCYLHCCLKYVQNEALTNESLRERFKIEKKNHAKISRFIKEAVESGRIKPKDPDSKSKKYASYLPFWA